MDTRKGGRFESGEPLSLVPGSTVFIISGVVATRWKGGLAMRTNIRAVSRTRTHEGGPAVPTSSPLAQLRRSVLSCLLWEREFYEDGQAIADRVRDAAAQVTIEQLAALSVEARHQFHLRHLPLLLLTILIERGRGNPLVAETVNATIGRADELAELLALYWKDGKRPLSGQLKRGLAMAFTKF